MFEVGLYKDLIASSYKDFIASSEGKVGLQGNQVGCKKEFGVP